MRLIKVSYESNSSVVQFHIHQHKSLKSEEEEENNGSRGSDSGVSILCCIKYI